MLAAVLFSLALAGAQAQAVKPAELTAAINNLGKFDAAARGAAARTVRRAPAAQAVPALIEAASTHADGYVRFRALVLLSGFNDPRARDVMVAALDDPNDRLRAIAYAYFEQNPEQGMAGRLLRALPKEESEFVRPALERALVVYGPADAKVREAVLGLVTHGQDLFRGAVIEAIGERGSKGEYALAPLVEVAKTDGPLQEDAVLALGRIGSQRTLETLAGLQRTAPRVRQPAIAAAICMLRVNCESHEKFVMDTLTFAVRNVGFQDLLRASARALAAIAVAGNPSMAGVLADAGIPATDPARAPIALAFGTVALRDPSMLLKLLASRTDVHDAALLLRDAFDMLEEDFNEERFFATVRRAYWRAPEGSSERKLYEELIQTLEF